jgi:uncharacterized protein YceH (UPF0502 family)
MHLTLTPVEARILGALIEKEITTPEYYPLSLNALTNACNQKSNRDPVLQLDESEIRGALNHLESQSLVRSIAESRATKYEHRLQDEFNFYRPEVAIICELLLRGPQTPGELRTRASRMHPFEDLESVLSALQRLSKREPPMVTILPRQPGTKEARYAHLLSDAPPAPAASVSSQSIEEPDEGQPETAAHADERVAVLTREVAELRAEVESLRAQFAAFRKQFE